MEKDKRSLVTKSVSAVSMVALFLLSALSLAYAEKEEVTPYGDYCKEFSAYGICRQTLPPDEALTALTRYYRDKGCRVVLVNQRGRFIVAEIYRHYRQVDKVVFDRKTGRLRSIY